MVGEGGERLRESDILMYLESWNATLGEPLPEKEIEAVVKSAMTKGTPREEKLPSVIEVKEILEIVYLI